MRLTGAPGRHRDARNRTLRDQRDRGLIMWENSHVTITNRAELKACAEFDQTYLNLKQTPR